MEGAAWAPKFETYRFHGAMQVGLARAVATLGASGFPAEGAFSDDLQRRGSAQIDRSADGTKRGPGQKKETPSPGLAVRRDEDWAFDRDGRVNSSDSSPLTRGGGPPNIVGTSFGAVLVAAGFALPRAGLAFGAAGFFSALAAGFLAAFLAVPRLAAAGFFAAAAGFLAAGFFAAGFFAAAGLVAGFFAAGFLAAAVFVAGFLAAGFFAAAAGFFAVLGAAFAAGFFAVFVLVVVFFVVFAAAIEKPSWDCLAP
jgi:hypothetical protein